MVSGEESQYSGGEVGTETDHWEWGLGLTEDERGNLDDREPDSESQPLPLTSNRPGTEETADEDVSEVFEDARNTVIEGYDGDEEADDGEEDYEESDGEHGDSVEREVRLEVRTSESGKG